MPSRTRWKIFAVLAAVLVVGGMSLPLALGLATAYRTGQQVALDHALIAAIKKNDTRMVISLLAQGANPRARNVLPDHRSAWIRMWDQLRGKRLDASDRLPALWLAVADNEETGQPPENVALVKALIDAGALVNESVGGGETLLIQATGQGKRETVRLLLERGANVNAQNKKGYVALHFATADSDPALVKLLLTHGARVDVKDQYGMTPMWRATFNGETENVRLLLASGSDVNIPDNSGETPLMIAQEVHNLEITEILKAAGAKK